MQGGTGDQVGWGSAVKSIAQKRESEGKGMDTHLMGATSGWICSQERIAIKPSKDAEGRF